MPTNKIWLCWISLFGCLTNSPAIIAKTIKLEYNEHIALEVQKAVIDLEPGDTLILPKGTIELNTSLSIFKSGVTIQGAGLDKTVLDFKKTSEGAQAILVRANDIKIKDLSVVDSPGDGIVARGVINVHMANLSVYWSAGTSVGGYGLYPVQCKNVLVEGNTVSGASEAGIYVGQTQSAIVSGNTATKNVVGIDIENSSNIQVINNTTQENSIGISVTGRPFLVVTNPHHVLIRNNIITNNNLTNFAKPGGFAEALGQENGIKIISTDFVTITSNKLGEHNKSDIYVGNFPVIDDSYRGDPTFNIFVEGIVVESDQFKERKLNVTPLNADQKELTKLPSQANITLHNIFTQNDRAKNLIFCLKPNKMKNSQPVILNNSGDRLNFKDITCSMESNTN